MKSTNRGLMSAISLILSGIGGTAIGAFQFTKGHIKSSMQSIFLGLSATNIGGRLHGLDSREQGEIMKCALTVATGTVGTLGAIQLKRGIKQRNISEIIKGTTTTVTGIAGTVLAYSLDSRTIIVAHQACVLGLTSSFIGALGFKDLVKGHYHSGLCKMALGIAGIATTVFYVYNSFPTTALENSEQNLFPCIDSHKAEIEEMYKTHEEVGRWKKLGNGISKTVFIHEECPGWVIKISNSNPKNLRIHHKNLEDIRGIASKFDRISLPESHLYPIENSMVLVEEMFNLEPYNENADQQETIKQFNDFVKAAGLCDMRINTRYVHNAGILTGSSPPRMGIIDFDCRRMV